MRHWNIFLGFSSHDSNEWLLSKYFKRNSFWTLLSTYVCIIGLKGLKGISINIVNDSVRNIENTVECSVREDRRVMSRKTREQTIVRIFHNEETSGMLGMEDKIVDGAIPKPH